MKSISALTSVLLAVFLMNSLMQSPVATASTDSNKALIQATDFSLQGLNKNTIQLQDYRGRLLVLNFWATFCYPCRAEMPSLQALSEKFGEQVAVLAISVDDEDRTSAIEKWVQKSGFTFAIALAGESGDAGEQVSKDYKVSALPVTYIINPQGQVIKRILGERDWGSEKMQQQLQQWLAQN